MITICVSPALLEQGFLTGNTIQHCRVLTGLPPGAKFNGARKNVVTDNLEFYFIDPEHGQDREITVTLQSWYHDIPAEAP